MNNLGVETVAIMGMGYVGLTLSAVLSKNGLKTYGVEIDKKVVADLNIDKSKTKLDWYPVLNFEKTIKLTVDWYKNYESHNVYNLCIKQIKEYLKI